MRLPIEPALRLAECEDIYEFCRRFGFNKSNMAKWERDGLSSRTADKIAAALNLTPHLVWGGEAWESCRSWGDPPLGTENEKVDADDPA